MRDTDLLNDLLNVFPYLERKRIRGSEHKNWWEKFSNHTINEDIKFILQPCLEVSLNYSVVIHFEIVLQFDALENVFKFKYKRVKL